MARLEAGMLIAAVVSVPVTLALIDGVESVALVVIDWLIWLIFVAEFLAPFFLPTNKRAQLDGYWRGRADLRNGRTLLSLAVVILSCPLLPAALGFVRFVRLARIARLSRLVILGTRIHMSRSTRGITYVAVIAVTAVLVGGTVMSSIEPQVVGGEDVASGIWWAAVTTIGVGLEDPQPESIEAKLIALTLMLIGVALITTLAAAIAAHFLGESRRPAALTSKVRD
jgi:voltage-gated potassium channel